MHNVFVGKFILRNGHRGGYYCTYCNYEHLHSKNTPKMFVPSIHSTLWVHIYSCWQTWASTQGKITVEYHYLEAFADLDSAWSTASLVSSSEQENRAVRTNMLPNPCWSQRSQEMKCKKQSFLPNLPPPHTPPLYLLSYFLSSLARRPPISRTVSLSLLSWKSAVSACLKVLRNFRKSLEVTLHLSTLSGTYPVHSSLRESKNCC